ncbi:MAG: circadian clock KaiB family protein [Pseudomonadota bacterium]|nr:circadian clock KaiB family protein [Pseudomonadota bacterium]
MTLQDDIEQTHYHFCLFVNDNEFNSKQAQLNLEHICQTYLAGRYQIEIIDVAQDIQRALEQGVLVTPLLKIHSPHNQYTIIGNLSDVNKILTLLGFSEEAFHVGHQVK